MEYFKKNPVALTEIKKKLVKKRKEGFDFVNFTGGEPTIHPDFLEILRFAKAIGYRTYIGTNGVMLARKEFCRQALLCLDEVSFSIHGHVASIHDALVGRKGAFRDIMAASDNVDAAGFNNKFANVVVVRDNIVVLPDILEFLAVRGFSQILFSNLAPEGMGLRRFAELSPKLTKWREVVPELAEIGERRGVKIRFFGLPLCALNGYAFLSNDLFWDARVTTERAEKSGIAILADIEDSAPDRNRIKTDACDACTRKKLCFGIFDEYIKWYGSDEIKPIA